jgi:hypothetical protein
MIKKGRITRPQKGQSKTLSLRTSPRRGQDADAELQSLHLYLLASEAIEVISDELRAVVEQVWPELAGKLPAARSGAGDGLS